MKKLISFLTSVPSVEKSAEDLIMKKIWRDKEGVSPVIAVILMVAITVVLAAVLYIMVSGMLGGTTEVTPHAPLTFREDDNIDGVYYGTFDGSIRLDKLEISVLDISVGDSVVFNLDEAQYGEVPFGLNVTVQDKNGNGNLDANDLIKIQGGDAGDQITLMYTPTGGTVATRELT